MRTALSILAASLALALTASAASIDGKWSFETKTKGKRGEQTVTTMLDLKTNGDQITGAMSTGRGKRGASATIKDGKIEGNRFSFTTVRQSKKGEQKFVWQGTLDGDQLKISRSREGKKRGQEFVAKRQ